MKIKYLYIAGGLCLVLALSFLAITKNKDTLVVIPSEKNITYINATSDNIVIELPFPGAVTGKAFSVIGKARGGWYFEASFPIEVQDKNGNVLATGIAQAQSEWMTSEFVPFKADIKVPDTYIGKAKLVLKKDNPSGMPENDASASFEFNIEY